MPRRPPKSEQELIRTADSHHVVLRALLPLRDAADKAVVTDVLAWSEQAIAVENARISNALNHLDTICRELEDAGCPITVMKSLDHWPDIGNDLDLYTPAAAPKVREAMLEQLNAWPKGRTWGDRLAQKHSFGVPDLRESVEISITIASARPASILRWRGAFGAAGSR